jgi:hypothetical protein
MSWESFQKIISSIFHQGVSYTIVSTFFIIATIYFLSLFKSMIVLQIESNKTLSEIKHTQKCQLIVLNETLNWDIEKIVVDSNAVENPYERVEIKTKSFDCFKEKEGER